MALQDAAGGGVPRNTSTTVLAGRWAGHPARGTDDRPADVAAHRDGRRAGQPRRGVGGRRNPARCAPDDLPELLVVTGGTAALVAR